MLNTTFHPEQIDPTCWIAPGAVVVGDVTLEALVSVWFHASLRGDTTPVHVKTRSNIQEGAVFHADPGYPCLVGEGVTVGHGAILHGCTVGDNVTVGMGCILMNGVVVGENIVIGAGAMLTQGKAYPPGVLILGAPGKIVRELTSEEIEFNRLSAETYVQRSQAFKMGYTGRA